MIKFQIEKNETVQPNTREIEKLKNILPQYFNKNGEFNLVKFKEMLISEEVNITKEGYELNFLGKKYAKFQSGLETETVIVPDNEHNQKEENINSENIYIVGDNIDALKHLLKSYSNKIKCIYIDPPYNTGSDDFVYPDNFYFTPEILSEKMGIDEEEAKKIIDLRGKSNHSAWLTFMYSRLELARDLLTDDGVIFISIDDNEHSNLKLICDEIFGEDSFIGTVTWEKRTKAQNTKTAREQFQSKTEYILLYKKQAIKIDFNLIISKEKEYNLVDEIGKYREKVLEEMSAIGMRGRDTMIYPVLGILPKTDNQWKYGIETIRYFEERGDLFKRDGKIYFKIRPKDEDNNNYLPFWSHFFDKDIAGTAESGKNELDKILGTKKHGFETVKPIALIQKLIFHIKKTNNITLKNNDIILDFFSGSSSTAHAIMELNSKDNENRKYIMVQLPEKIKKDKESEYETIDEIGRERIIRVGKEIKEKNPNVDCGFKLFKLKEIEKNTLDKIVEFDPETPLLMPENYVELFNYKNTSGKDTILTTWLNEDGYGLIRKTEKIKLFNYDIDICSNSAYIIDLGITSEDIIKLIEMIENNQLLINRIVIYPYSIPFNIIHELKNNLKQLHKDIKLIERY